MTRVSGSGRLTASTSHAVGLAVVCCGVLATAVAVSEAPGLWRWLAVPAVLGAVAAGWRPTRWLAALPGLCVVALSVAAPATTTAVLAGVLVLGFLLLTDLAETIDLPDLAASVPETPAGAEASRPADDLAGWARPAGVLWLAGSLTAVAVAAATGIAETSDAVLVAVGPVLAILAAYVALGRRRA